MSMYVCDCMNIYVVCEHVSVYMCSFMCMYAQVRMCVCV